MSLIVSAGDTKAFLPAPEGTHQAVCIDVIDKGLLEVKWNGSTKLQHKADVAWQIGEARDDGKRFVVYKRYTMSLSEKANLRKDLESWRGKPFTEDELKGFDVEKLIGVNCLINVQHRKSGDKTYANVVAVMPLIKGMPKMGAEEYVRQKDRKPDDAPQAHEVHPPDPVENLSEDDIPF